MFSEEITNTSFLGLVLEMKCVYLGWMRFVTRPPVERTHKDQAPPNLQEEERLPEATRSHQVANVDTLQVRLISPLHRAGLTKQK